MPVSHAQEAAADTSRQPKRQCTQFSKEGASFIDKHLPAFVKLSGVSGGRASLIESILADSALRVDELGSKAWTADVVFHRLDNQAKQGAGKKRKA